MSRLLQFFSAEDPRTGELFNAPKVQCQECGAFYRPLSVRERDAQKCPDPLHAIARLRAMGIWTE